MFHQFIFWLSFSFVGHGIRLNQTTNSLAVFAMPMHEGLTWVIHALCLCLCACVLCVCVRVQGWTVRLAGFFRKIWRCRSMTLAPFSLASIPAFSCVTVFDYSTGLILMVPERCLLCGLCLALRLAVLSCMMWYYLCTETYCAELYDVLLLVHQHDRACCYQQAWQRIRISNHFYVDQIWLMSS